MHTPLDQPRESIFYSYKVHPYCRPPELNGIASAAPVVIVGAGPIGLAAAVDLARFGVRCVVLEQERQVSEGSRAIVLTRRSMEILQQIGADAPFRAKGLPWKNGRSFYRGTEVYQMEMPHDDDDQFLPGLNIQQQYIEEYLVDACEANELIEIRWGQKVTSIRQDAEHAVLTVDTADGEYELQSDWVVAADGGRSTIRKLLELRMEGRSYPGNFVIADIKAKLDLPTERLCFFDPDWNPGNNVLVHREPEDIWRIDFRLPDGETAAEALQPELLTSRINAVLAMINRPCAWEMDWATVYSANTLTLPDFRHGRVVFIGDAAHLLPIFGVRGANTGFQDANALMWRLALVAQGKADDGLLDTFSSERVQAAREICEEAGKSTRFMNPPSAGFRLMRDAVLSFSLSEDFPKALLHWRTSRPHDYTHSPLNSFPEANAAFDGGFACGAPARNVHLAEGDYLFDRIGAGAGFHLLVFADALTPEIAAILAAEWPVPVVTVLITQSAEGQADLVVHDPDGKIAAKYAARSGGAYLLRPDLHVCARWQHAEISTIRAALRVASQGK